VGQKRVVSLSPALTETLFAIGAGDSLVGVSDYCDYPKAASALPKAGTSITPNFEAIARLAPTTIVTEGAVNTRGADLERLAEPVILPWLSLDQVVAGVRRLGQLTAHSSEANRLAAELREKLAVKPPATAPRVLLVLGYMKGRIDPVWFIRRNSIHGAALRAAGGKNAVERDVSGQPRVSLEQVIRLDPDVVVVLTDERAAPQEVLASWRKVKPLRAVKDDRIAVLRAPEAFSNGPRILRLVERLRSTLQGLAAR
jgi:iron complex transport system substrate-binding protein